MIARPAVALAILAASWHGRAFAEDAPADIVRAAKERMHGKPWKVEALVQGEKGFKVAGVIDDRDFDLTVKTARGSSRQIALGEQGWTSADGGKTWKKAATIDRRHYFITHTPIRFRPDEKIPPFERLKTSTADGDMLLHVRFIAPDEVAHEGDRPNAWIAMDGEKPIAIRRYAGPLGFENEYVIAQVRYAPVTDGKPIQPPPGNPAAAPATDGAGALLGAALRKMQTGVWEVDAQITSKKRARVHGLIVGRDFDLSMEPEADGTPLRQIAIKDKSWASYDRGKTWKTVAADDRPMFHWVHGAILSRGMLPDFEAVGRESRDAGTLLHLRLKVSEKLESEKERPHYWLALDADGKSSGVRRYEGNLIERGQVLFCEIDYRPAKKGAAIKPRAASATRAAAGPPPPIEGKPLGFFGIEAQKFELAGKVVRVEITGKVLGFEPIGDDTVRAMVKDTSGAFGQVEFPRAALEKLGLSRDYDGKPVMLYLLITPQGKKPAARAAAVGSKFTPASDGSATYEW